MQSSPFTLTTADGTELYVNRWLPDGEPKGIVQLVHGLAEHSGRYARFAERLTASGYAVYASDHRGHGRTSGPRGVFAEHDGWLTVVDDLHAVTGRALDEHPDLPVFLVGMSMGSFLSRTYASRHGSELAGLVLLGTAGSAGALGQLGVLVAKAQSRVRGHGHTSGLLDTLSFGRFNAAFRPTRTSFDWLSRDPAEVDKYVADPDCGFVLSAGGFADMLQGLADVNSDRAVATVPKDLPVHLASGSRCQVGAEGKGPREVADRFRRVGVQDVTLRMWPEARHEILNETNRDEVEQELVDWLDAHLSPATG
jgi:alpha-beta hydrolase superfamily lysophospholipase